MAQTTTPIQEFSPLILLFLPILFIILKQHPTKPPSPPLPPGPFSWPIIGNILQMGNKPHITLTQFSKTYGPLFSLKLGTQLVVVGSNQAAAIEILKTHDRALSGRHVPHMAPTKSPELNPLSLGWVMECNEKWKCLRTMCKNELFSIKALETQEAIREKKAIEMVNFVKKIEGSVVGIREVVTATVFNMLSNVLVSRDLISLEHESVNGGMSTVLNKIAELATTPNVSDYYPILGRFDLQGLRKKALELHKLCFNICEDIIRERREGKMGGGSDASSHRDFLDALIKNGSSYDQINILLLELLSAGTDTSSSTIEWAIAELIKNPKCLKKLQEEINTISNNGILKETHLQQLKYLQACIKETLRLHPPGPFLLPHRAIDTCQVMNYTIPRNSQVLVNFYAIGRDPNNWEEATKFIPERFLGSKLDYKGNDFEFIPFGSGRRICPGLPMAIKHVTLVVAYLVHFFDWSVPGGKNPIELDMSEKYGLTLRMEQPLLLVPKCKIYERC